MPTLASRVVGLASLTSLASLASFGALACGASTGQPVAPAAAGACATPAACEQRAAARLEAVRHDPAALAQLLHRLPKGADLHNHMSGAVYAESYLACAREDGLGIDAAHKLVDATTCGAACTALPAAPDDPARDAIVRAWSMKDFQPGGESGHDHFFAAFSKFGLVSHEATREPAMLAETIRRAGDDGAIHVEVMVTIADATINAVARDAGAVDPGDLAGYARTLRADPRWPAIVGRARDGVVARERQARALLRCDTPDAAPACAVSVGYVGQVGRTSPPGQIYAELLAAFEVGAVEPRVVAVNLVSPEDNATALENYDLQMKMIGALHDAQRGHSPVRVTLHAGELIPALAAPANLAFHVRDAVEIAHAERIGHAVDVLGERDAAQLLGELRDRGVTIEICLTSNAFILDVAGAAHPLGKLLDVGVPVALATDDAGVSRSSLTGEMVRAVTAQGLGYLQLKRMARASVTAAFVPGASLWAAGAPPSAPRLVDACAAGATAPPSPACAAFLAGSARARLQWKLEQQLAAFEAQ